MQETLPTQQTIELSCAQSFPKQEQIKDVPLNWAH